MRRWYLVHAKPCGEALAQAHLQRQGYEVYLPQVLQPLRRRRTGYERVVALFPRYLFLRLNEGQQALAPVRSSLGVSEVVRFGSSYATVPDRVIRSLRERADPQTGLHRLAPRDRPLAAGDPVTVSGSPFEGIDALFESEAGEDRVVILLRILGRDIPIRLPACHVLHGCVA